MAINYPLPEPIYNPTSVRFGVKNSTVISRSPFTLTGQTQDWGGQIMTASVTIDNIMKDQGEYWVSYLMSLRGSRGHFSMRDPMNRTGTGSNTMDSTTTTTQTAAGSSTINLGGFDPNQVGPLKVGEWVMFVVGNRLYYSKIIQTTDANASGVVTIDVWPTPTIALPANSPVILKNAYGWWRLSSGEFDYYIDGSNKYSISFECESMQ